jgi:two-component system chemotaxis response regulator CheB
MNKKIKVLVVDDSVAVQQTLTRILSQDDEIEVINTASDPYEAVKKIADNLPDVITLDIEMPRMDGITFLRKLMKQHPIPVVVVSSVVGEGSEKGIKALELGASEIITKPKLSTPEQLEEYSIRIIDAVKAAALTERVKYKTSVANGMDISAKNEFNSLKNRDLAGNYERVILIGASTGGTEVISKILKGIRTDLPGILIVQHMPGEFTNSFAKRLNQECRIFVKEAENGDVVKPGSAYIANGYNHLRLAKEGDHYKCKVEIGPLVNRHRPSVDVLFRSAINFPGKNVTAILLTGMGADGAQGLLELREREATTIVQDEKSSAVFGMPREAIRLNAVQLVMNPDEIIRYLNSVY